MSLPILIAKLKKKKQRDKIPYRDLASQIGIDPASLHRILAGHRKPALETYLKMEQYIIKSGS